MFWRNFTIYVSKIEAVCALLDAAGRMFGRITSFHSD